jgi:hypothetical protein
MLIPDVVKLKRVTREAVLAAIKRGVLVAQERMIKGRKRWVVDAASARRWQPRLRPGVREA